MFASSSLRSGCRDAFESEREMSLEAGLGMRVFKSAASEWDRCKGDGTTGVATAAILLREGDETEWVRFFRREGFILASDDDDDDA
jgi:hypothetical protein